MNVTDQRRKEAANTVQAPDKHMHSNCTQLADKLRVARLRMIAAKDRFSKIAVAALRGNDDVAGLATAALQELNAARTDLKRLQGAPPPQGVWAESARLMSDAHE